MRHLRHLPILLATVLLTACTEAVEPERPDLQGTYEFTATIAERPGAQFTGEVRIVDSSQLDASFSGTYDVQLLAAGGVEQETDSGSITGGAINRSGSLSFYLGDAQWSVMGTFDDGTITGTYIRGQGAARLTGSVTAVRQGS